MLSNIEVIQRSIQQEFLNSKIGVITGEEDEAKRSLPILDKATLNYLPGNYR